MAVPSLTTMNVIIKCPELFGRVLEKHKTQMIKLVRSSVAGTSDISRLTTGASILTALAFESNHATNAWTELLVLLANKFPFVRKQTAEIVYERLLFQEDTPQTTALSQALLEAAWDGPLEDVMRNREKLCEILKIKPPARKQKTSRKRDGMAKVLMDDENASYKTLVDDFARGM